MKISDERLQELARLYRETPESATVRLRGGDVFAALAELAALRALVGKATAFEDGDVAIVNISVSGQEDRAWRMRCDGGWIKADGLIEWPTLDAALSALAKWRQGR